MKNKLLGLYKLTRVNDYFAQSFATVSLMATFSKGTINPFVFIHLFLVNLFINAFSFAINDLEDAPDDTLDPQKRLRNPISAKLITHQQGLVFTTLLAIISILLVWPLGRLAVMIALASLILGFFYSYKPVRLKSIPIIDLVSHGLFLGVTQILVSAIGFGIELNLKTYLVALIAFSFSVLSDFTAKSGTTRLIVSRTSIIQPPLSISIFLKTRLTTSILFPQSSSPCCCFPIFQDKLKLSYLASP